MSDTIRKDLRELERTLQSAQGLRLRVLETYASLWRLEICLRQMVYVELKTRFGDDWLQRVPKAESSLSPQGWSR